ncbi:MAG: ATP-binding protein [bacterium]|nr:ATP-binding protein [bacterium]
MIYKRKIVDKINKFINSKEVLVLHGARQVGKTSLMFYLIEELKKRQDDNIFYFDLEISRFLELANAGHDEFFNYLAATGYDKNKKAFVFLDEIQYLDDPSKFLKLFHDNYGGKIKLIASGSSSFEIKRKFKNSLVGRTVNFEIWPLSFEEFLIFKNKKYDISAGNLPEAVNEELKKLYKEYVIFGAYPQIVLENDIFKKEVYLNQIISAYIKKDIRDLARIKDISKFNKLIEILAAQTGNLINILELSGTAGLARQTVEEYLFLLENTYIIKLVKPFYRNLRSELFKTPKIYFIDHGLANLLTFKNFPRAIAGNIFETAVFSDLLKKYGADNIHFWRTSAKQEIDFIVNKNKTIWPIEAKINAGSFKSAAMDYFVKEYKIKNRNLVFLEGKRKNNKSDQIKDKIIYSYPWEI